jgi:hypothetical protein
MSTRLFRQAIMQLDLPIHKKPTPKKNSSNSNSKRDSKRRRGLPAVVLAPQPAAVHQMDNALVVPVFLAIKSKFNIGQDAVTLTCQSHFVVFAGTTHHHRAHKRMGRHPQHTSATG